MARFRSGLALVGVVGAALAGCGSSGPQNLNTAKAESEIRRLAEKVYSAEATVGAVRCPNTVQIKKGLDFFCTVDIDGTPLRINLRQTDNQGNVHLDQGQAVIFTKKAEDFVASYANQHGSPARSVSCGNGTVLTRTPGTKITCTVAFADGRTGTATMVVNDTAGKVGLTGLKPSNG